MSTNVGAKMAEVGGKKTRRVKTVPGVSLLGQEAAIALDVDLMETPGFSVDQLMELAGLSVACAVVDAYPKATSVLIVAGPGNNGGDGLVAARHLNHFGVDRVEVVFPKQPGKPLFQNLVKQCEDLSIPVVKDMVDDLARFDVVLDAVFGFSFYGVPRAPFDTILQDLEDTSVPLVSVDTPSGWHVEDGPTGPVKLKPDVLVSLTAPKKCSSHFDGRHSSAGASCRPASKRNTTSSSRPTRASPRSSNSRIGPTSRRAPPLAGPINS